MIGARKGVESLKNGSFFRLGSFVTFAFSMRIPYR